MWRTSVKQRHVNEGFIGRGAEGTEKRGRVDREGGNKWERKRQAQDEGCKSVAVGLGEKGRGKQRVNAQIERRRAVMAEQHGLAQSERAAEHQSGTCTGACRAENGGHQRRWYAL
ncbi:hypothetical protein TRVL_03670 [Trypanosoma vivax]|nr:hypothetical protein TRVL_03670 [Trypanosoma vivax]